MRDRLIEKHGIWWPDVVDAVVRFFKRVGAWMGKAAKRLSGDD